MILRTHDNPILTGPFNLKEPSSSSLVTKARAVRKVTKASYEAGFHDVQV